MEKESQEPLDAIRKEDSHSSFIRRNRDAFFFVLGVSALSGLMNIKHGTSAVLSAAGKQCGYSLVSAMVLLKIYDYLAERTKTLPQELIPMFGPALLTTFANYGVHSLKGTAEPLLSSLPTAAMAMVGFPLWHLRVRLQELENDIKQIDLQQCFNSES